MFPLGDAIGKQDVRESIDTSVYEDALAGLVKENPGNEFYARAVQRFRATNK